jgi:DNA-binding transcriptional regulator YiaG
LEETWIPVTLSGFEDRYDVSSAGRLRGWYRHGKRGTEPRILSPGRDKYGHLYVNLINETHPRERPKRKAVHLLVAEAFNGPRPPGLDTRHLDGNRLNNEPSNLKYGTRSENVIDSIRHGTHKGFQADNRGSKHPLSKLSEDDIESIRNLCESEMTQSKIATSFGVSPSTVSRIKNRKRWHHV